MRNFSSYHYIVNNNKLGSKEYYMSWRDIQAGTGISRSSLNLMLNGKIIKKFSDYTVERCVRSKEELDS
jgi:hypothetical protein